MNKNLCKIIGFSEFNNKEDNSQMLRIVLGIESSNDKYSGLMVTACFLPFTDELKNTLNLALKDEYNVYYETKENIISGKTKITNIYIEEN